VAMRSLGAAAVVVMTFAAGTLQAQTVPLSQILQNLITSETVINVPGSLAGIGHTAHFVPDLAQQQTPRLINNALVAQLPTFPLGSSSGGFTYSFDSSIGASKRSSRTFGPSFAERSLTNGKGHWNFGLNYQHSNYDKLEGQSLTNGDIKFYVRHNDCCPGQDPVTGTLPVGAPPSPLNPAFEGDIIQEAVTLNLKTDIGAFFANYGVSDRLDIGVAVPIIRVEMAATVDSTLLRLGTANNPTIHQLASGDGTHASRSLSGTASGVGDIVLRAKYLLFQAAGGGLSAAVDLRLPSGKSEDLLGVGTTQTKVYLIASGGSDRVAPHVNFGYTFSRGSGSTDSSSGANHFDEVNYVGGLDVAASNRLTIAADVIGRELRNAGRLQLTDTVFNANPPAGVTSITRGQFSLLPNENLNLLLGVIGAKANVTKTLLVTGNLLFPLTNNGLRSKVTPVIGFDYSF
jgi:hypothetical protein